MTLTNCGNPGEAGRAMCLGNCTLHPPATTTDTRPSIAALTALREGWPAELTPVLDEDGDWDGKFDHPDNDHSDEVFIECSSYGMDEAPRFAALIAAEHNATPVLLEVVAAAQNLEKRYDFSEAARRYHFPEMQRLIAALAKVRQ